MVKISTSLFIRKWKFLTNNTREYIIPINKCKMFWCVCVCVDIKGWKALTKYLAGNRNNFILTFYLFTNLLLFKKKTLLQHKFKATGLEWYIYLTCAKSISNSLFRYVFQHAPSWIFVISFIQHIQHMYRWFDMWYTNLIFCFFVLSVKILKQDLDFTNYTLMNLINYTINVDNSKAMIETYLFRAGTT